MVETGKNVTTVRRGDLISVEQIQWCGKCRSCRTGMFNQCEALEEVGLTVNGGLSEYAVVPEKYCCKLNDEFSLLEDRTAALEAGALAEPASVAYSGMVINAGNYAGVYPEIACSLANGAKVVQLGIGSKLAGFEVMPFLRKNAHIIGSMGHAGRDVFPSVIRMMASGRIDIRQIVTGRYNLEKTAEAIKASGERALGHGKILVSSDYP